MKEKNAEKLKKELKYLLDTEIEREIELNSRELDNENIDIKKLANYIYIKRGIDINKLNNNYNFLNNTERLIKGFKNKDKDLKIKMLIDLLLMLIILFLLKAPFDLVRDIGYEYIEIISNNNIISTLWNLLNLIGYTITLIFSFIKLIKNYSAKYNN